MNGTVAAVPGTQPLEQDGIWRVVLAGEGFGRLVRHCHDLGGNAWRLLRLDELSDDQLDAYEAAMQEEGGFGAPSIF